MKSSLLVFTSALICFTSLKGFADGLTLDAAQSAPIADAQKKMPPMTPQKTATCMKANNPHRIEIKHIEAKGIGYDKGYTSLDGFFTSMWNNFIPFLDLRAHVSNNGRWAANAGIGSRYIFDPCQWMVGANVYYDYRNTKHASFNQVGVGAEAFYDRYEFHLNGYLPVGQKRTVTKKHIESVTFKGFSGNYILQNENYDNTCEGAMKGFNGELGTHIAGDRMQYDLYFGVGPYYYDVSDGKHAWGGKARLKAEVTKYLFLEVSDSYDRIFHNRVQGTVNVSIPFGGKHCYPKKSEQTCSNVMDWQAVLPVERQEIIVVSKFKKKHTVDPVAIDPITGQPFFVIFVNNTNDLNGNLGDGTFENPFANLTNLDNAISAENAANDGNIIYVFAGDGSSTGMSGGNMTLNPNNRLLGSANPHNFQTSKGVLAVPTLTSLIPHVSGQSTGANKGSIINLANNCEISGFDFSFPFASPSNDVACINGAAPLINSYINNNNFVNETFGVFLGTFGAPTPNATGTFILTNNTATGQTSSGASQGFSYFFLGSRDANITVTNNVSHDIAHGAACLFIRSYGGDNVNIANNVFKDTNPGGGGAIVCGVESIGTSQPDLFVIKGNTANNTGATFSLNSSNPNNLTTFIVEDNEFINATATSQIFTASNQTICVRFNNNKGYPYLGGGTPVTIGAGAGGTLNLEPPLNNFPQPTLGTVTSVPACSCGQPCN